MLVELLKHNKFESMKKEIKPFRDTTELNEYINRFNTTKQLWNTKIVGHNVL